MDEKSRMELVDRVGNANLERAKVEYYKTWF
jgi:hypothetical protein